MTASAGPAVWLAKGTHTSPDEGMCLLELVARELGQKHTARPEGVSPVLTRMGGALNDALPDEARQRLAPLRFDLPGTDGDGLDDARAWMATDWLARVWLPAWLDLVPAGRPHAEVLRGLPPVLDATAARRAEPVVAAARQPARATARAIPKDAAWAAAWAAAWSAAWAVAWAARAAVEAAEAAAEAAAEVAHVSGVDLQPTIDELQLSAIELYGRMARLGRAAS